MTRTNSSPLPVSGRILAGFRSHNADHDVRWIRAEHVRKAFLSKALSAPIMMKRAELMVAPPGVQLIKTTTVNLFTYSAESLGRRHQTWCWNHGRDMIPSSRMRTSSYRLIRDLGESERHQLPHCGRI